MSLRSFIEIRLDKKIFLHSGTKWSRNKVDKSLKGNRRSPMVRISSNKLFRVTSEIRRRQKQERLSSTKTKGRSSTSRPSMPRRDVTVAS